MTGARTRITRRDGEFSLELEDRMVRESETADLMNCTRSVAWFELPEAVGVSEEFTLEPVFLAALLSDQQVDSTKGRFVLKEVDGKGQATLEGQLLVAGTDVQHPKSRCVLEGACTLVVDTSEKRLLSAEWKGEARLTLDDGEVQGSGIGTFESRLSATTGVPAREALARKITYRDVPRTLDNAQVSFDLPSHWFDLEGEEAEVFRTSVHGAESLVTLEFRVFAVERGSHDGVVDAALAQIQKDVKLVDQKGVTSPLGKGRSARFRSQTDDGKPYESLVEFYPCGADRLLRVQLYGEPKAFADELKAWPKIQHTLKLRD